MNKTLLLPLLMFSVASCRPATVSPAPTEDPLAGRLTFAGSTTVQPLVSQLADDFRAMHPHVTMEIAAGGSAVGIQAVHDGTADIGMASRNLSPEEASGIILQKIAIDVLAIIVHPDNPVSGLTLEQLRDCYLGRITNWRELGGADMPILPVQRETSSGSRGAFDELVLEKQEASAPNLVTAVTAGDMAARVAGEPGAVGYVGFGNLDPAVKALAIGGVVPNPASAKDGSYPLIRPLFLLTGPLSQPLAQAFIDFVLGAEGQNRIQELGWIPVR
ncbi:MAG: phosphate ABC transporter substrate-binding protein [Anaerolineales bacterium]|nr:phosphate ABC transporter substrate-binding protein [Anaerolineales bacterium]